MKSIAIPFRFSGGNVAFTKDPDTIVRQKIVDYLVTGTYERFGMADYGANLNSLVFTPMDELLKADLKTDIIPGLQRYVSNVSIIDMDIEQDDIDPSLALVTVVYKLPLSPRKSYSFNLANDLTEETPL